MDNQELTPQRVNYRLVFKEIWKWKKLYAKVLSITFVLSAAYILCVPREYTTSTAMAPEMENAGTGGALGSIAASFGFDISEMQTSDAITPLLYPDLLDDNGFIAELFKIQVENEDKTIKCDYYTYLKNFKEYPWWTNAISAVKRALKKKEAAPARPFDPYHPTKKQEDIMEIVRENVALTVDKKNGVISITVSDQDRIICKTIADSLRSTLQTYITNYRTKKASADYEHYKKLTAQAKADYEKVRQHYGYFADSNTDVILQSYKSKEADLENEMQLKYNAYSAMVTQMDAARTKVQERTPAFTTIKGASVPIKPASPKRMLFVLGCLVFAFMGTSVYVLRAIVLPEK